LRRQLGGSGVSDDDLLLRYFSSEADVAVMKTAGSSPSGIDGKHPILTLIESFRRQTAYHNVEIRSRDMVLRFGRKQSAARN
jgi:hypothetical protein